MKFHYSKVIVTLAIIFSLAALLAFFPGSMTWDSLEQLKQARTGDYQDWHPVIMSLFWSFLLPIKDGPGMMLLFHVSMLWASSIILYRWSNREGLPWGFLFLLTPILPWVINFEFVVWKDVGMAYSWGLAVSICLYFSSREKFPVPAAILVGILLLYGALVRANSLAAVPFLFVFFAATFYKKKSALLFTLFFAASLVICVSAGVVTKHLINPKTTNPISYVMFDDVTAIKLRGGDVNLDFLTTEETKSLETCKQINTSKVGAAFCLKEEEWRDIAYNKFPSLKSAWTHAVTENTSTYLTYRAEAFLELIRSPSLPAYYTSEFRVIEEPYLFDSPLRAESRVEKTVKDYVSRSKKIYNGLFKPYTWLLLSVVLIIFFKWHKSCRDTSLWLLPASGLFYVTSYLPVTPAADFRYVYWLCFICSLSVTIAINRYWGFRKNQNVNNSLL